MPLSHLFPAYLWYEGLEALDVGLPVLGRAVEDGEGREARPVARVQHVHAHLAQLLDQVRPGLGRTHLQIRLLY